MGTRSRSPLTTGSQYGLAVAGTAVNLTVPNAAMVAEIYVRTAPVVFTRSGTAATATAGFQANAGDIVMLNSRAELDRFSVIRASGVSATVDVEYFSDLSG